MTQHPVGVDAQEGRARRGGRPASSNRAAAGPWDGQGTEFNRSFRKLSGSVISVSRPAPETEAGRERECAAPLSHGCRIPGENTLCSNKSEQGLPGRAAVTGQTVAEPTLPLCDRPCSGARPCGSLEVLQWQGPNSHSSP